MMRFLTWLLVPLFVLALPLHGQQTSSGPVRVFLDCSGFRCDDQFFQSEIDWVSWVRDRQDSDVHLLITRQRTGGGGWEFTLEFLGRGPLADQHLELRHLTPQTGTDDEERQGLARTMRIGFAAMATANARDAGGFEVRYEAPDGDAGPSTDTIDDPWDFWTFRARVGGAARSEARRTSWDVDGAFGAERVTEDWKIELQADGDQSHGRFEVDSVTTVRSEQHRYGAGAVVVRSIGPHW
jgi:hypothetical protein